MLLEKLGKPESLITFVKDRPGHDRRYAIDSGKIQRELGWNRNSIIKGFKELKSGIRCIDNFSARGRRRSEDHLPHLLEDIKSIVEPVSQADPTFRTDQTYCPLTAGEVRRRLIEEKNYSDQQLPKERTIRTKLNQLGFKPQKVAKSKPKKKLNR